MVVNKIEFYAYLPKIQIYFFFHFKLRSDMEPDPDLFSAEPDPDPRKKMTDPHPYFSMYIFLSFKGGLCINMNIE